MANAADVSSGEVSQYQLFPPLSEHEYDELKADIAARGVMVPVEYDDQGNVLDGHNRVKICDELGIADFPSIVRYGLSDADKRLHVRKLNLARRHLTREQRAEIMRQMRAEGNTLQEIADATGVSLKTAHRQTESTLSNDKVDIPPKIVGADGKARPATYKPRALFTETAEQREKATEPETAERITSGAVKAQNKLILGGAHVGKNSGENEWYTPEEYIKSAVDVMGGIDLDPASSADANAVVQAATFFSKDDDGLTQEWTGRVWMNPPYAQPLISDFAQKLVESVASGSVTDACVLVNNATETRWFQQLASVASAICFPTGRIRFWSPSHESAQPLQGQAILYYGDNIDGFSEIFSAYGFVAIITFGTRV